MNRGRATLICRRNRLETFTLLPPVTGDMLTGVGTTTFDNIPNYAEFSSLYRQYMVLEWSLIFRLVDQDESDGTFPTLYIWKQTDTALAAVSITPAYVQRVSGVKVFSFSAERRNFRFTVRPYMVTTVFAGATPGYLVIPTSKRQWLDMNYPDVSMYGICYMVDDYPTGTAQKIFIDQEWKVALRGMA